MLTPPPTGRGAIAVIRIRGDVGAALVGVLVGGASSVPTVGRTGLRSLATHGGEEECVVARWSEHAADIMPHAGAAVVAAVLAALTNAGVRAEDGACAGGGLRITAENWRSVRPEAETLLEARQLDALSRAASPMAIDAMLAQVDAWRACVGDALDERAIERYASEQAIVERSRVMKRLIDAPTVAVVGRANIGKSSLLNALAGEAVALVADEAGTTRDHVGALVNLGGLVVRWADLPGIEPNAAVGSLAAAAMRQAETVAASADLLVLAADADDPGGIEAVRRFIADRTKETLTVALRADRCPHPVWVAEVAVSVHRRCGLETLVDAIGERLVPRAQRAAGRPWRFW